MPRLHSLNCQILNVVGLKAHVQLVSEYLQALSFKMKNHVCNMVFHLEVIVDVISIWCKNSFMPLLQLDYRKSIFKVHIHLANSKCSFLGTKDKVLIRSLQSSENSSENFLWLTKTLLQRVHYFRSYFKCIKSNRRLLRRKWGHVWRGRRVEGGYSDDRSVWGWSQEWQRSMWGCCRTCMRTVGQWWGVR